MSSRGNGRSHSTANKQRRGKGLKFVRLAWKIFCISDTGDDISPEESFNHREIQGKQFVHADNGAQHMTAFDNGQHPLKPTVSALTQSEGICELFLPPSESNGGTIFAPTSFHARMAALHHDNGHRNFNAISEGYHWGTGGSIDAHYIPFDAEQTSSRDSDIDSLGDSVTYHSPNRISILTHSSIPSVRDYNIPVLHFPPPLQDFPVVEQRFDDEDLPPFGQPTEVKEHYVDIDYLARRPDSTRYTPTFPKNILPPTARGLTYTKRPVKHLILSHNSKRHSIPSLSIPSPLLIWAGIPGVIGRVAGTHPATTDATQFLSLMIDTGAEKTLIKKSACPPNTVFHSMAPLQVGGLGGQIEVTQMALFKLIFSARDECTSQPVDVAINVCADVVDDSMSATPAIRNFDAIFGYPALLAYGASVIAGDHTPLSAELELKLTDDEIFDMSRQAPMMAETSREAFEMAPIITNEMWTLGGLGFVEHRASVGMKRTVRIPLATTTGIGFEKGATAVEAWYEGRGRIFVDARPNVCAL